MTRSNPILLSLMMLVAACKESTGQHEARTPVGQGQVTENPYYTASDTTQLRVPLDEWKELLPPALFHVAFEKGTERPFTGKFKGDHEGVFHCAVCGQALFEAGTKFESGTGWPSFYAPLPGRVQDQMDTDHGMVRDEVLCARCGAHLGHVFDDGPEPTGLRYCINAVSLSLEH